MTRQTIDVGIDLGLTRSAVAVADGGTVEVIRNNDNTEFTPSAVAITPGGTVRVGRRARERVGVDPENATSGFRARMGAAEAVHTFSASGRTMTPAELSAEVLGSLRGDVLTRRGEDLDAAVVTVPAGACAHQVDATRRAATLAGITTVEVLSEPAAVVHAYLHHDGGADRAFWLVVRFDDDGFYAAVIGVRDGGCTEIAHHGDHHLGGRDVDRAVVDEILVPAVHRDLGWTDLARGSGADPGWRAAVAGLTAAAEDARIALSGRERTDVVIDLRHDDGRDGTLEVSLTRDDLDRVAGPYYRRAVKLARKAVESAGLADPRGLGRVVLSGGTDVVSPLLRDRLAEDLGIPVDAGLDPVTVVARGAAVYAAIRPRSAAAPAHPPAGTDACRLEHEPVGDDPRFLVGGTLAGDVTDWTGWEIRFTPPEEGHRVPVRADGTFTTELLARDGTTTYTLDLVDPRGTRVPVSPAELVHRLEPRIPADDEAVPPPSAGVAAGSGSTKRAAGPDEAPTRPVRTRVPVVQARAGTVLPASIGLALRGGGVRWLVRAGTDIGRGHRVTVVVRTPRDVRRGRDGLITATVVQGEHDRAERNRRIGRLEVTADDVRRDVAAGSAVEITAEIGPARRLVVRAHVPALGQHWDTEIHLDRTAPGRDELAGEADRVARRIAGLGHRLTRARAELDRLSNGQVDEVRTLVDAVGTDPDAADACEALLTDLQVALDRLEMGLR